MKPAQGKPRDPRHLLAWRSERHRLARMSERLRQRRITALQELAGRVAARDFTVAELLEAEAALAIAPGAPQAALPLRQLQGGTT